MDVTLEALKRYLVMQLIETSTMKNSTDVMNEINENALNTAKTMKGINSMWNSPFKNQQQQPPNVFNGPNPYAPPPYQQQQPAYSNEDIINFVNEMQQSQTALKNELNDLKAQVFDGMQNLHHSITQSLETMKSQKKGS